MAVKHARIPRTGIKLTFRATWWRKVPIEPGTGFYDSEFANFFFPDFSNRSHSRHFALRVMAQGPHGGCCILSCRSTLLKATTCSYHHQFQPSTRLAYSGRGVRIRRLIYSLRDQSLERVRELDVGAQPDLWGRNLACRCPLGLGLSFLLKRTLVVRRPGPKNR
jgi:hypothetical protein